MRRQLWVMIVGSVLATGLAPASARAQAGVVAAGPMRMNAFFAAPGLYGTSYGSPSFGMTRTYSVYSSSYGLGYSYGYSPYGLAPSRYGVGLWRPGVALPGYAYGASYYNTYPAPYVPGTLGMGPSIGVYAPGFGPPSYFAW